MSHRLCSSFKLRPGFDPSSISEAVDTIEVPTDYVPGHGRGSVSGLVASRYGLMAVLEGIGQKMFIYNQKRTAVLEFPLDCSYVNQMTFDRHHNIVIAKDDQSSLLRYNMNGKALPNLKLPEHIRGPTGVACSPEGDLYVSCNDPYTILKQAVGCSEWVTIYSCGHHGDYDAEDEDEALDPGRFYPGQMSFGSDGELFVAAETDSEMDCINVFAASDGKLKRRIVFDYDMDRDDSDSDSHDELCQVEGICATGDGYLFACDTNCYVHVFTVGGDYLRKFGGNGDNPGQFRKPWAITVDCSGYLLISDHTKTRIQVY